MITDGDLAYGLSRIKVKQADCRIVSVSEWNRPLNNDGADGFEHESLGDGFFMRTVVRGRTLKTQTFRCHKGEAAKCPDLR